MSKKLIKLLSLIVIIFFSVTYVNALSLPEEKNSETNYSIVIEDDANLLSEEELNKLQEEMRPLTEYGNIIFKSISRNYGTTESYASDYYSEKFGSTSGTLLLIDMENRTIYIFSDGMNYKIVTKSKANIITDNIYSYASRGDYYKCASVAFSQINTILEGGKINEPMRHISNILLAITIAFFISFFIVLASSSQKKASSQDIINNAIVDFKVSNVRVTKTGTHTVYSPISSSNGSSSGGSSSGGYSSSGGGHSSGGGGGHKF